MCSLFLIHYYKLLYILSYLCGLMQFGPRQSDGPFPDCHATQQPESLSLSLCFFVWVPGNLLEEEAGDYQWCTPHCRYP